MTLPDSLPPIRLVICDIDGTLVRHDKSLPQENIEAVKGLLARGIPVSLISARPIAGMQPIIAALGLTGPFAAFNGGTLFDGKGAVLSTQQIPADTAQALLGQFTEAGVTRWLFAGGKWLTSDVTDPHTPRERISSGLEPETDDMEAAAARADKLVAVSDDPALLAAIEARAVATAGNAASVVRSQSYYLDVTARGANKGEGVTALASAFGVPLEQTAVLGDNANDVAMFRRAGLSIAMGQAEPAVRAEADYLAASNDDCGVADGIARFVVPRLG
ncbi:MAG: Cof-type HAD-IIB family hydrolase [Novosphingobium sp.]